VSTGAAFTFLPNWQAIAAGWRAPAEGDPSVPVDIEAMMLERDRRLEDFLNGLSLHGVPAGGTTGQALVKLSNADYDVGWGAGGGGANYWKVAGGVFQIDTAAAPAYTKLELDASDWIALFPGSYCYINPITFFQVDVGAGSNVLFNAGTAFNVNAADIFLNNRTTVGADLYVTNRILQPRATASVSGAVTVDFSTASTHYLTLTGNVTALTLSNTVSAKVCSLTLYLVQDGTGSRLVTWPASVKWPNGIAPTLSTTANAIDIVVLETLDGGTTWFANVAGKAYA